MAVLCGDPSPVAGGESSGVGGVSVKARRVSQEFFSLRSAMIRDSVGG